VDSPETAPAAPRPDPLRTRRSLLTGGLAALSALAAIAGNARPAQAANGDEVKVGQLNSGNAMTILRATGATAFSGQNQGGGTNASGVHGQSDSTSGRGVLAIATATGGTTFGVLAESRSPTGRGVRGYASATSGANIGVLGQSASGTGYGVQGIGVAPSGVGVLGSGPIGVRGLSAAPAGRGVLGSATATSGLALGVFGYSDSTGGVGVQGDAKAVTGITRGVVGTSASPGGTGVQGFSSATSGETVGVEGRSDSSDGIGVWGRAEVGSGLGVYGEGGPTGAGGYFAAADGAPGSLGIAVLGRAEFSTCGIATIPVASSSVVVSPGVEITSNTKVLATLQDQGSPTRPCVSHVLPNTAANTFQIFLNESTSDPTPVAWFVIG
jgi:hypothetical protein